MDSKKDLGLSSRLRPLTAVYSVGLVLVFVATVFIWVALFTSNWQKTAPTRVENHVYYTFGLWFICSHADSATWHDNIYHRSQSKHISYQGFQAITGLNNCEPIKFNSGNMRFYADLTSNWWHFYFNLFTNFKLSYCHFDYYK